MRGHRCKYPFETFVAIRIDFIKEFTYLLHFYFSEKANVMTTQKLDSIFFG